MKELQPDFEAHELGSAHKLWVGRLPGPLLPVPEDFKRLWQLHPEEFHEIKMPGGLVKTPRWQQAFGRDYHYTGRTNRSMPIPASLEPFLKWSRENVASELNGLLLNWYDGRLGHYIGRHRDSIKDMIPGTPIMTISVGEDRIFRLRRWPAKLKGEPIDFPACDGSVFVMPWETNLAFTHEVPRSTRQTGRRISITLRGFIDSVFNASAAEGENV